MLNNLVLRKKEDTNSIGRESNYKYSIPEIVKIMPPTILKTEENDIQHYLYKFDEFVFLQLISIEKEIIGVYPQSVPIMRMFIHIMQHAGDKEHVTRGYPYTVARLTNLTSILIVRTKRKRL